MVASLNQSVLAMTILVRDGADILADNIRFHHHYGVDAFVVGDNGSQDNSRSIVKDLAHTLPIHLIDFPAFEYRQRPWRTKMTRIALQKFNARWVINNDADEFWLPQSSNLKYHLRPYDRVVQIARSNMLAMPPSQSYYESSWRVSSTINYAHQRSLANMSLSLVSIKPKVIVNPRGLIHVKSGSHSALHLFSWRKPRVEKGIQVYHYPMRSYDQFLIEAQRMAQLLARNPQTRRIGEHKRRWAKMLDLGKLKEEYNGFFFSQAEVQFLESLGIIVQDRRMIDAFRKLKNKNSSR